MSDQFVAEIRIFGCGFVPAGWAACDGQLLPIAQNAALFSLLGTTYGGDGVRTFGLPDLRGRVPMHPGQGAGLSQRELGESGGHEQVVLAADQLPAHSHGWNASNHASDSQTPDGSLLGPGGRSMYAAFDPARQTHLSGDMIAPAPGGNRPHNNMQPYLTVNFCIALTGTVPTQG